MATPTALRNILKNMISILAYLLVQCMVNTRDESSLSESDSRYANPSMEDAAKFAPSFGPPR